MKALIRCTLHLSKKEIDEMFEDEDLFYETWGQVQFYLKTTHVVKFS